MPDDRAKRNVELADSIHKKIKASLMMRPPASRIGVDLSDIYIEFEYYGDAVTKLLDLDVGKWDEMAHTLTAIKGGLSHIDYHIRFGERAVERVAGYYRDQIKASQDMSRSSNARNRRIGPESGQSRSSPRLADEIYHKLDALRLPRHISTKIAIDLAATHNIWIEDFVPSVDQLIGANASNCEEMARILGEIRVALLHMHSHAKHAKAPLDWAIGYCCDKLPGETSRDGSSLPDEETKALG